MRAWSPAATTWTRVGNAAQPRRLIANRLPRPVDSQQVVQQALDNLVKPREQALAA
jgi:hypothetical protein